MAWRAEAIASGSMDAVTLTSLRHRADPVVRTPTLSRRPRAIASSRRQVDAEKGRHSNHRDQGQCRSQASLGAGATPTWDNLIDGVGRLRQQREPTAQIMADRTLRTLSKIKEGTTNAYMFALLPQRRAPVDRNQVPVNLTVGTSSDT